MSKVKVTIYYLDPNQDVEEIETEGWHVGDGVLSIPLESGGMFKCLKIPLHTIKRFYTEYL